MFKRLTIKPDYPKHTNIKELDAKISEAVVMGYSHILCNIDMDTKGKEPQCSQYQNLKAKYAKPIDKLKKGISVRSSSLRHTAAQNCSSSTIVTTNEEDWMMPYYEQKACVAVCYHFPS